MTWKATATPGEIIDDVMDLIAKHSKPASEMTEAEWYTFAAGVPGGVLPGGCVKLYVPGTNDVMTCSKCGGDWFGIGGPTLEANCWTCGERSALSVEALEADAKARDASGRIQIVMTEIE